MKQEQEHQIKLESNEASAVAQTLSTIHEGLDRMLAANRLRLQDGTEEHSRNADDLNRERKELLQEPLDIQAAEQGSFPSSCYNCCCCCFSLLPFLPS